VEDEAIVEQAPTADHDDDAVYVLVPVMLTSKGATAHLDLGRVLLGLPTVRCCVSGEVPSLTICFAPLIVVSRLAQGNPCALLCRWLV
jgi:hypothetical protein